MLKLFLDHISAVTPMNIYFRDWSKTQGNDRITAEFYILKTAQIIVQNTVQNTPKSHTYETADITLRCHTQYTGKYNSVQKGTAPCDIAKRSLLFHKYDLYMCLKLCFYNYHDKMWQTHSTDCIDNRFRSNDRCACVISHCYILQTDNNGYYLKRLDNVKVLSLLYSFTLYYC